MGSNAVSEKGGDIASNVPGEGRAFDRNLKGRNNKKGVSEKIIYPEGGKKSSSLSHKGESNKHREGPPHRRLPRNSVKLTGKQISEQCDFAGRDRGDWGTAKKKKNFEACPKNESRSSGLADGLPEGGNNLHGCFRKGAICIVRVEERKRPPGAPERQKPRGGPNRPSVSGKEGGGNSVYLL